MLKIDDPLDAAAVHGFCGAWGLLMAACFSWDNNYRVAYADPDTTDGLSVEDVKGAFMGGNGKLLGAAVVLILAITAWVLGHMIPFFFVMRMIGLLRVDEAEERMGLDVSHHGGSAYEATQGDGAAVKGREVGVTDDALLSRCVLPSLRSCCGATCMLASSALSSMVVLGVHHCRSDEVCADEFPDLCRVQYLEQQVKAMRALPVDGHAHT